MRRPWLRPSRRHSCSGCSRQSGRADRRRALGDGVSFRDLFLSGLFLGRRGKNVPVSEREVEQRDGGAEGDGEAEWVPVSEGGGTRAGRLGVRELAAGMSYNGRGRRRRSIAGLQLGAAQSLHLAAWGWSPNRRQSAAWWCRKAAADVGGRLRPTAAKC